MLLKRRSALLLAAGMSAGLTWSKVAASADAFVIAEAISPCWPTGEYPHVVIVGIGAEGASAVEALVGCRKSPENVAVQWVRCDSASLRRADSVFVVGSPTPSRDEPSALRMGPVQPTILADLSATSTAAGPATAQVLCVHDFASMLLVEGHVAVDYEDLRIALGIENLRIVTAVETTGTERVRSALGALHETLGNRLSNVTGMVVSLAFGPGPLHLEESTRALTLARRYAPADAHVIYGTSRDLELQNSHLRATILAS